MRKFFGIWIFILLAVGCIGCTNAQEEQRVKALREWMRPSDKLKVLCTIGMISDVVEQIGGDAIETHTLISAPLDPHSYEIVKGDTEIFDNADLVFYNGLGLEHGPSLANLLHSSKRHVALGEWVMMESPERICWENNQVDPHIWMDISLWAGIVEPAVAMLSEVRPEMAAEFKERGQKVVASMLEVHEGIRQGLESLPVEKRYLVTSHDAFNYFCRAYLAPDPELSDGKWKVRCDAPEGLSPEAQLSTTDIQRIVDHLLIYRVGVIFPEANVSRASIAKVVDAAGEKGLAVTIADDALYGDSLGAVGSSGDTYLKMIQHNADVMRSYMEESMVLTKGGGS